MESNYDLAWVKEYVSQLTGTPVDELSVEPIQMLFKDAEEYDFRANRVMLFVKGYVSAHWDAGTEGKLAGSLFFFNTWASEDWSKYVSRIVNFNHVGEIPVLTYVSDHGEIPFTFTDFVQTLKNIETGDFNASVVGVKVLY